MKLSDAQNRRLNELFEQKLNGVYASCVEPTMCALERRKFATWRMVGNLERWYITTAGALFHMRKKSFHQKLRNKELKG